MLEIKENQELNVSNVLCYRGKGTQEEIKNIGKDMEYYIQQTGAKCSGATITATYAVEGELADVEILIPIDKRIEPTNRFVFKKQIKIVNAVVASFKGHPARLQEVCNQLTQYISEHKLQPITVGYNVTKVIDLINPENTEVDIYVGISQNIL